MEKTKTSNGNRYLIALKLDASENIAGILTLLVRCSILMWNGSSRFSVVHLHGKHARTHQVPTNLDYDAIRLLHLNWNPNDGKAISDSDSRMTENLRSAMDFWGQNSLLAFLVLIQQSAHWVRDVWCLHSVPDVFELIHGWLVEVDSLNVTATMRPMSIDQRRLYLNL